MIERARATGLYAELDVAEIVEGLARRPDASADLILAADVMVYVHDMAPLLAEVARVLAPGGLFAFTLESHAGEGVVLGEGLRYAHGAASARALIEAAASRSSGWSRHRPAPRAVRRCRAWSWSRRSAARADQSDFAVARNAACAGTGRHCAAVLLPDVAECQIKASSLNKNNEFREKQP